MTLDQKAWCAPISLKISKGEEKSIIKIIKASPVDKGTTTSTYGRKPGHLVSRVIQTAQNKKYNLQAFKMDDDDDGEKKSAALIPFSSTSTKFDNNNLVQKRLFEESFSENLLKLQVDYVAFVPKLQKKLCNLFFFSGCCAQ